jgi:hypothetical protein
MFQQIRAEHELPNEVRVCALSEKRIINHLEPMFDAGRFVDVDVRSQSFRLLMPHERDLEIGVGVPSFKTASG